MTSFIARRLTLACAAAVSVLALAAGPALAAKKTGPQQCSGINVTGQGANVASDALSVWTSAFNTSANAAACSGTQGSGATPKVTYTTSSSGIGLESWGVGKKGAGFSPANAYVITEEPPNPTEKAEIESNETTVLPETVETLPVFQEAIPVLVHLPSGCTATSTSNPGRLVLNNTTLEGIFRGTIKTWGEITDGGDTLTGTGCGSTSITRVVRDDSAGSTHIFKKYLSLINATTFESEKGSSVTWNQISEGPENTTWPKAAAVVKPAKTGDNAEIAEVAAKAGSIGYGSLANSRKNASFVPPNGGAGTATFWTPIENTGTTTKKPKYQDPSTNGEVATAATANCVKTKYTNGTTKFPPKTTVASWSEVTTATKETHYPACGIGYALTLKGYSDYPATESGEATTVENFAAFVLATSSGGGQTLIASGHDYEPLTTALDKEALKGAAQTVF
jgi:ABC-type phosphate transport system substrate-binding protein